MIIINNNLNLKNKNATAEQVEDLNKLKVTQKLGL